MKANDVIRIGRNRPRRLDRGFQQWLAVAHVQFERHLDDQDGVLGRQRDQQDDADLGVEIVLDS